MTTPYFKGFCFLTKYVRQTIVMVKKGEANA